MIFPWKLAVLIAILTAAGIYYLYYGKDLASPSKELLRLRLSLLCLVGFFCVGYFTEPSYSYYIDTSPTHIQTVDDARRAIQKSNETIEKLANDSHESVRMIGMTLGILILFVLPSFLRLSGVLGEGASEEPSDDDDKLISIFDHDKP
jgi:hypothetical protein